MVNFSEMRLGICNVSPKSVILYVCVFKNSEHFLAEQLMYKSGAYPTLLGCFVIKCKTWRDLKKKKCPSVLKVSLAWRQNNWWDLKNHNHDFDIPGFFGPIINHCKSHLDFSCISLSISKTFWSLFPLESHGDGEIKKGKEWNKTEIIQIFAFIYFQYLNSQRNLVSLKIKKWQLTDREREISWVSLYVKSNKKWCKWTYLENGNRLTGLEK